MVENNIDELMKIIDRIIEGDINQIHNLNSILEGIIKRNREVYEKARDGLHKEILDKELSLLKRLKEVILIKSPQKSEEIMESTVLVKKRLKLAILNQDIPRFIGKDNIELGPFKKGDIISINEHDLNILREGKYLQIIMFDA